MEAVISRAQAVMTISATLKNYLDQQAIKYELVSHPEGMSTGQAARELDIDPRKVARMSLVKDDKSHLMVVYSSNSTLDFETLNHQLHSTFTLTTDEECQKIFHDCETAAWPCVAEPYNVLAIIDQGIDTMDDIYFEGGTHKAFVHLSGESFKKLHGVAWHGSTIAYPNKKEGTQEPSAEDSERQGIKRLVKQVDKLPAMPDMAQKLLRLRNDENAGAKELARVIEMDPSLSAQLIRYAKSPLYGYQGNILSIRDVISRVLGYELSMDIALGVMLGRDFKNPTGGPLGLKAFWRHAVYCASITQSLCSVVKTDTILNPGLAYLAGLVHNVGFLLQGHLFKDKFSIINKTFEQHPETPVTAIEKKILGVTHPELGSWLMNNWHLPEEVVTVIREHHNQNYSGKHDIYVHLVFVANCILKSYDIGDSESEDIPDEILTSLGIDDEKIMLLMDTVIEGREALDSMATYLVA